MLISAKEIISRSLKLYGENYQLYFRYLLILFIPAIAIGLAGAYFGSFIQTLTNSGFGLAFLVYFIFLIASSFVSLWISLGFIKIIYKTLKKENILTIKEELQQASHLIIPAIVASLLTTLAVVGGMLLLIVPGIIFSIWFAFSLYAVAIDGMSGVEAMKKSKQLVRGQLGATLWRLLVPGLFFGLIIVLTQWIVDIPLKLFLNPILFNSESAWAVTLGTVINALAGIIISILITPLSTTAPIILYTELKNNPGSEPVTAEKVK